MVTPSRITLARKRRGMTLAELAPQVGVSSTSLSYYECGRKQPSPTNLASIAEVLSFPVSFFSAGEIDEIPVEGISFRSPSKIPACTRDAARSSGRLAVELHTWLEGKFRLPQADIPTLDSPDAETAAEMVRSRWGLGNAPISNMIHLLESHGIRVFSLAPEVSKVDAFSFWRSGTPFVCLNVSKSAERSRFDAAHELGHLVLHGESRHLDRPDAELEANAFARAFLMPRSSVISHMPPAAFTDQILKGRAIWKVSAMALTYRLRDLDMLSEWHYRMACIELSKRGYRSNEPDGIKRETSQLLDKAFRALRNKRITPNEVARDIHLTLAEFNSLIFGLAMTAIPGGKTQTIGNRPKLTLVSSETPEAELRPAREA